MSKCSIWYFDNFMVSRDRFLREDSIWLHSLAHRMRFGILSWQQRNVKWDRLDFIKRSQARVISIYLVNNAPSVVKMILNLFFSSVLEYKVQIYALDHRKCFSIGDRRERFRQVFPMVDLKLWNNGNPKNWSVPEEKMCIRPFLMDFQIWYESLVSQPRRPDRNVSADLWFVLWIIIRGDAYLVGKRLWKTSIHVLDFAF